MNTLRWLTENRVDPRQPCGRCDSSGCAWDRIGGEPICPDCQEALAQGIAAPLIARCERRPCAVCAHIGALRYVTFPLGAKEPLELDLCPQHFRDFVGRRLDSESFAQLRRGLERVRLSPRNIFLLHEAFYDEAGEALQPALEVE
jgi:hypothetical protein